MTRRILITVEYDGGPFYGWQRQIDGSTVQQVLEQAAAALTGSETLVQGAGRTDSGVHATGQAAHLDVPDKFDAERVMQALNALTGDHPVSVISAREVPADFHARFSATSRRYLYRILPRRQPPALDQGRVWHHRTALDEDVMQHVHSCIIRCATWWEHWRLSAVENGSLMRWQQPLPPAIAVPPARQPRPKACI